MKTRMRPRKKTVSGQKGHNVKYSGRSIEARSQEVLSWEEFGHWKVDQVLGKKTKNEPIIITMVKRKTRYLLTKKVWGKNAEMIQRDAFVLMGKQGIEQFKSLTIDNGLDFSNLSHIEK